MCHAWARSVPFEDLAQPLGGGRDWVRQRRSPPSPHRSLSTNSQLSDFDAVLGFWYHARSEGAADYPLILFFPVVLPR